MIFLDFLKVKNLWKYAPKRTIPKKFFGEACPRTLSKLMATPRVASPPPKKKKNNKIVGPLGKSCIRQWTTTKKFIWESTLADS